MELNHVSIPMDVLRDERRRHPRSTAVPRKNLLYDQDGNWAKLTLPEQLEYIRLHYCTGPYGQSCLAGDIRSRTSEALREAMRRLRQEDSNETQPQPEPE